MDRVKHIILVLSGKGGVGKSSVSVQLALALLDANPAHRVGVLDIDLCGPSIPRLLGLEGKQVHQSSAGWVPVVSQNAEGRLSVLSIGFLLPNPDDPVIWRGPKKNTMIRQFVNQVCWGDLDYLIIDTPPGTSDEHISIAEYLKELSPDGAVIVTTPQAVALSDVRKEMNFCKTVSINILGVVENMSGFVCPHCSECTNIFSKGGGEAMAADFGVPFLGRVPIDPAFAGFIESNREREAILPEFRKSSLYPIFQSIAGKLIEDAENKAAK